MADAPRRDEPSSAPPPHDRPVKPWLIAVVVVVVLCGLFISQNRARVRVDFVVFDRSARTWVVIVVSMALGALLAELVRVSMKRRRRSTE